MSYFHSLDQLHRSLAEDLHVIAYLVLILSYNLNSDYESSSVCSHYTVKLECVSLPITSQSWIDSYSEILAMISCLLRIVSITA